MPDSMALAVRAHQRHAEEEGNTLHGNTAVLLADIIQEALLVQRPLWLGLVHTYGLSGLWRACS